MAYSEFFAQQIRDSFLVKKISWEEKKMMGGLCYMVDDKMCCGIYVDKKSGEELLMSRVGSAAIEELTEGPDWQPMMMGGRVSKDFILVTPEGYGGQEQLSYWVDLCLAFNPHAKSSKKTKSPKK